MSRDGIRDGRTSHAAMRVRCRRPPRPWARLSCTPRAGPREFCPRPPKLALTPNLRSLLPGLRTPAPTATEARRCRRGSSLCLERRPTALEDVERKDNHPEKEGADDPLPPLVPDSVACPVVASCINGNPNRRSEREETEVDLHAQGIDSRRLRVEDHNRVAPGARSRSVRTVGLRRTGTRRGGDRLGCL